MGARAVLTAARDDLLQILLAAVTIETGIVFGTKQLPMVQSRLTRRMRELGFQRLDDYLLYFSTRKAAETPFVISLLTTHHTYFFREYSQFEYLEREGLDHIISNLRQQGRKELKVWSAACSHGQEAYSLAMFFLHHLPKKAPDINVEIFGSDICRESVDRSQNGVYKWEELKRAPALFTANHWIKGTGEISNYVKAGPRLRSACRFGIVNLNEMDKGLNGQKFDLILCRNVFIYFSPENIETIATKMMNTLHPGGLLGVGVSETLTGLAVPAVCIGPSVYTSNKTKAVAKQKRKTLKVACVDDSSTVLAILKKILTPEFGFEVVATAASAEEAETLVGSVDFDVMTLDIHMPGKSGVDYVATKVRYGHPPVVMVSSVSQSDSNLALRALELGAKDYVEKPELSNFHRVGDELRAKLRCALVRNEAPAVTAQFARPLEIKNPTDKLRIILAGAGDIRRVEDLLKHRRENSPPTVLLFYGTLKFLPTLCERFGAAYLGSKLEKDHLYIGDFQTEFESLNERSRNLKSSLLVVGQAPDYILTMLERRNSGQILGEEGMSGFDSGVNVVPLTSFEYESSKYLALDEED